MSNISERQQRNRNRGKIMQHEFIHIEIEIVVWEHEIENVEYKYGFLDHQSQMKIRHYYLKL